MSERDASTSAHVRTFLEMLAAEKGAARNTLDAYARDLDDLAGFLAGRNRALVDTTPADLTAYIRHLSEAGFATATRARKTSAVRQLFRFLAIEGTVDEDPAAGLTGPKLERALPRTLSVAEVERLLETARTRADASRGPERIRALRLHAMIEVLYASGMRVSELVALPRQVLTGDPRVLTITGKGGKQRLVPLNSEARAALDRYLAAMAHPEPDAAPIRPSKWLFPARSAEGHVTRQHWPRCRARQPARLAPRLREPPARSRRRPQIGAAVPRPRRHLDDADLHSRPRRAPQEDRHRAPSAGAAEN